MRACYRVTYPAVKQGKLPQQDRASACDKKFWPGLKVC